LKRSRTVPSKKKATATKLVTATIPGEYGRFVLKYGELRRGKGRPGSVEHLFKVVAEKIPFAALAAVKKHFIAQGLSSTGVYVAHDSMGCPRYIGRGNIFIRLASHLKAHPLELIYFSFYVVKEKKHEREIETLLIRAAGPLLHFNDRKKRIDVAPGRVSDFEARTFFYERQQKRGKKPKKAANAK
jgi:hypothetical protein